MLAADMVAGTAEDMPAAIMEGVTRAASITAANITTAANTIIRASIITPANITPIIMTTTAVGITMLKVG